MPESTRDLGYLAWKNDLAWMESQKTKEWMTAIKKENTAFQEALKGLPVNSVQRDLISSGKSDPWIWKEWTITHAPFSPIQVWKRGSFQVSCWDADISTDRHWFAAAIQDLNGFERFAIHVYSLEKKTSPKLHHVISSCGPHVRFCKNDLIYSKSSKDLRYDSIHLWNSEGHDIELYVTKNPTEQVSVGKAEDGAVYVIVDDFVEKRLGFISDSVLYWKTSHKKDIFVTSFLYQIFNQRCPFSEEPLESMSLKAGWAVTRSYGIRTLWNLKGSTPTPQITVWGEISFDARDPYRLSVSDMRYEPYIVNVKKWVLNNPRAYPFPMTQYRDPAPTFVVFPENEIQGLLVSCYSAYGSPTHMGGMVHHWMPLLLRGWAIASVCVPGGGDHTIEWKEKGQRENRKIAIDTLRKAVEFLQEEHSISPKNTCLYGRSAGGLLVISTATLYSGLVGSLYVESPYVDVLRTISNKDLPLTNLETREFGIGTNPVNILATQEWSPMEHIPAEGLPNLFVIARSDTADLEVFPYEVMKWIWRIRGKNETQKKLLYIHTGKGHFTTNQRYLSEDLALLDQWNKSPDNISFTENSAVRRKNRSTKYKMAMSRKNRKNMTRKNRKDRKDRKDKKNSPAMMGGRKSTRRARKHTRRH